MRMRRWQDGAVFIEKAVHSSQCVLSIVHSATEACLHQHDAALVPADLEADCTDCASHRAMCVRVAEAHEVGHWHSWVVIILGHALGHACGSGSASMCNCMRLGVNGCE